jgi:hypothetical protein
VELSPPLCSSSTVFVIAWSSSPGQSVPERSPEEVSSLEMVVPLLIFPAGFGRVLPALADGVR